MSVSVFFHALLAGIPFTELSSACKLHPSFLSAHILLHTYA